MCCRVQVCDKFTEIVCILLSRAWRPVIRRPTSGWLITLCDLYCACVHTVPACNIGLSYAMVCTVTDAF